MTHLLEGSVDRDERNKGQEGVPGHAGVRRLNIGCGTDIRPASEGWVNMELTRLPGVDVAHDILRFPWPFQENHFDHLLLSHILEHVPHDIGIRPYKDGFLAVLEECHRITKPGGRVEIFTPHPASENTIIDPTHTRVVHPANFEYFDAGARPETLHYSSARFRTVLSEVSKWTPRAARFLRFGPSGAGLTTHLSARLPGMRRLLRGRAAELHVILEKAGPETVRPGRHGPSKVLV